MQSLPSNEKNDAALQQQLHDVQNLSAALKRLLARYETTFEEEGIRQRIEGIGYWMESYRLGLEAAAMISQAGPAWLSELRERLKLAVDEMRRLESEGGNAADQGKIAKTEEALKAVQGIEKDIEHMLHHSERVYEAA